MAEKNMREPQEVHHAVSLLCYYWVGRGGGGEGAHAAQNIMPGVNIVPQPISVVEQTDKLKHIFIIQSTM